MITKREYKKTLIRIWDTARIDDKYKGANDCSSVECEKCPVTSLCGNYMDNMNNAYELIEFVEKWGKEHPIVTNGDKFKEVFGFEIEKTFNGCAVLSCPSHCDTCPNKGFWNKEYKGVEV